MCLRCLKLYCFNIAQPLETCVALISNLYLLEFNSEQNNFDDNGVLIKIYCMNSKLVHICLYVCRYVVSTLLLLPGDIGQTFHPPLYSNGANNVAPKQGIPSIQWGQGLTRRTNTLQVPSMVTKSGLIEGSTEEGVELMGVGGHLDLILSSGMGN